MTETQLRALIREVVSEILARPQTAAANPAGRRPNALVLFSGALLGFEASLAGTLPIAPQTGDFARQAAQTGVAVEQIALPPPPSVRPTRQKAWRRAGNPAGSR